MRWGKIIKKKQFLSTLYHNRSNGLHTLMPFWQRKFICKKLPMDANSNGNKRSSLKENEHFHRSLLCLLGIVGNLPSTIMMPLTKSLFFQLQIFKKAKFFDWNLDGTAWINNLEKNELGDRVESNMNAKNKFLSF